MKLSLSLISSCILFGGCDGASSKANFGGSSGKKPEKIADAIPTPIEVDTPDALELKPSSIVLFAGEEASFSFVNDKR